MRYFLVVSLLYSLTLPAFGQKKGEKVIVIAAEKAELRAGDVLKGTVPRGNYLRVDDVNGDWFWVRWNSGNGTYIKGWINRSDIMPLKPISKAIDFYTKAIKQNPTADDYNCRGTLWSSKGEHDIALGDYNEAIRLNPKYVSAWYNHGNVWYYKKEYDKAIKDYSEAIRLDPRYVYAWYSRGLAWGNKKEYDKAIKDYDEVIRLDPRYVSAWYSRGRTWDNKKEYNKAINDYSEAIRLSPKWAASWYNRGLAQSNKKEYDKAIKDYDESIRLDPKLAVSWNSRAWLLATCPDAKYRNGTQAVKDAKQACELTEWKNWSNIDTYGMALAEAGKFDEAIKQVEKAMNLNANYAKEGGPKMLKLFKSKQPYHEE